MQENISLYQREGSTDKVYHVQLVETAAGWLVNMQNGRREGTLTPRTKTPTAIDFASAKKIYDKLVQSKMKDGMTAGEDGTPFTGSGLTRNFTGIVPQLLNEIDAARVQELINDDDWVMEEKFDGHRRLVQTKETMVGINREGLESGLPQPIADYLAKAPMLTVVDGELIGDKYHLFDCLSHGTADQRQRDYIQRRKVLKEMLEAMGSHPSVVQVYTAQTTAEKRALYDKVAAAKGEGVVFKRRAGTFKAGRPASGGDHLKFKFVASATVIVHKLNKGKRSVGIAVLDAQGTEIAVGNVTIPANYEIPQPKELVEVQYLYAFPGGSLFQPVYKGVRDDIAYEACLQTQLKYKAGTDEESETEAEAVA